MYGTYNKCVNFGSNRVYISYSKGEDLSFAEFVFTWQMTFFGSLGWKREKSAKEN